MASLSHRYWCAAQQPIRGSRWTGIKTWRRHCCASRTPVDPGRLLSSTETGRIDTAVVVVVVVVAVVAHTNEEGSDGSKRLQSLTLYFALCCVVPYRDTVDVCTHVSRRIVSCFVARRFGGMVSRDAERDRWKGLARFSAKNAGGLFSLLSIIATALSQNTRGVNKIPGTTAVDRRYLVDYIHIACTRGMMYDTIQFVSSGRRTSTGAQK